jgi:glycosyltransferase involved in cell wall biosynthesis
VISIVTPSLDQGAYLEAAVQSVLAQPAEVEYVVIDGGSTDGSVDIIRRYEDRLAAWRSEPDGGQYDALNKGFALTSGELMGWLNADDFYFPGAFAAVEDAFRAHPQVEWIVGSIAAIANERGEVVRTFLVNRFSRSAFLHGFNLAAGGSRHGGHFVPQESVFWRRSLWERAGGLDGSLALAGDFDLWARFYAHADLWGVRALLGCYRVQPAQKTRTRLGEYLAEADEALRRQGGRPFGQVESVVRRRLSRPLSRRLHRLPTKVRSALEGHDLAYRTPELVWDDAAGAWVVSSAYFV